MFSLKSISNQGVLIIFWENFFLLFLEEDIDVEDFGNWNPESIPLLQRTIDQARSLGVKRTLSWMAGTHTMQELPEADQEQDKKPWHWARKLKVFLLTVVCIIVTVLLLFLPEESKKMEIVTVDRNLDYVVDIDEIYQDQSFSSSQTILEVTLEGSFIGKKSSCAISRIFLFFF